MVHQFIGRLQQIGLQLLRNGALRAHIHAAVFFQLVNQRNLARVIQSLFTNIVAGIPRHKAHQHIRLVRVKAHVAQLLPVGRKHGGMQVEKLLVGIQALLAFAKISQEGTGGDDFGAQPFADAQAETADLGILINQMGLAADP